MAGLDALNGLAESIEPKVAGMSTQSGLLEDFLLTTGGRPLARVVFLYPPGRRASRPPAGTEGVPPSSASSDRVLYTSVESNLSAGAARMPCGEA